jgi:hypothetical protein
MSERCGGHFGMMEISTYFLYYTIGYEICSKNIINKDNTPPKNAVFLGFGVTFIVLTLLALFGKFDSLDSFDLLIDNGLINWARKVAIALSGSMIFISFARLLNSRQIKMSKYFSRIGINTLGIYALDTYFIIGLSLLFNYNLLLYPLAVALDLAGSYMLTGLIRKNKRTSFILLGEYK